MKRPRLLLKVAAVACALMLVAALVCYRVGAFNRPKPAESATEDEIVPAGDDMMFSSSKSDRMLLPAGNSSWGSPDDKGQPAIMYSTKSAPIIQPDKVEKVDVPAGPTKPPSDPK